MLAISPSRNRLSDNKSDNKSSYICLCFDLFSFIQRGGGGLVFQDRYRLDRLARMKNFSQCRKLGFFWKK
jgi:hypothetical protein